MLVLCKPLLVAGMWLIPLHYDESWRHFQLHCACFRVMVLLLVDCLSSCDIFCIFHHVCSTVQYLHALTINSLNMYLVFFNFYHELNYIWNVPVFCEVYKGASPHTCTSLFLCIYSHVACQYLLHYSNCSCSLSCFISAQLSFSSCLSHL